MVQKSAVVGNDVKEIVVINQAGCGTEADDFEQDFEREFLHSIGFDNVVLARMAVEIPLVAVFAAKDCIGQPEIAPKN